MSGFLDAIDRAGRWVIDRIVHHVRLLADPESMAAAVIITVWAALAGQAGGTLGVVVAVLVAWFLHAAAVETGSHVSLWLSTAGLLILVVVASAVTLRGLHPVLLAGAGATVLAHNEMIRLNYTRRRRAEVDPSVFQSSAIAITVAGVLAVVGVAVANSLAGNDERTWLWMPVATGALLVIGVGLSLLPTWRAPEASRQRWLPGERIPPPPPSVSGSDSTPAVGTGPRGR